jgi:hypothetical protein
MPNRMLKDWTNSEKMKNVSTECERLFIRLIMKADDFGCFYAEPSLVRAHCFPLILESIKEKEIKRWLIQLNETDLIRIYSSSGMKYLYIPNYDQRLRATSRKYPAPPADIVTADPPTSHGQSDNKMSAPEKGRELEEEEKGREGKSTRILKKQLEEIVKTGDGKVITWSQMPGPDHTGLTLPDLKVKAAIELLHIAKNTLATSEQILGLWEVFKIQNFTGSKFYGAPADTHSHFINWVKSQPIADIQKKIKESKPLSDHRQSQARAQMNELYGE